MVMSNLFSMLWMSFKGQTHYGDEQLIFYVSY
jgi:hypothetical protein